MRKQLFNVDVPINSRSTTSILNGTTDGIINPNRMTYPWAYTIYKTMLNCTWFPEEVDMTADKADYKELLQAEKRLYDLVICQLTFNDSIQTNNLGDNVNPWITAPEVNLALARQIFEEGLHSQAYGVMIESIADNTDEVYDLWKTDKVLKDKNIFIGKVYEELAEPAFNGDFESQVKMIIANQILEGIYFMSGFLGIYALARLGKMKGSAINIKFINRDEYNHLGIFLNIFREIYRENQDKFSNYFITQIANMFEEARDLEINWGLYSFNNQILGVDNTQVENYIKYLTYDRVKKLSTCLTAEHKGILLEKFLEVTENPLPWVDKFTEINDTKTDFFASDNQSYTKGTVNFNDI